MLKHYINYRTFELNYAPRVLVPCTQVPLLMTLAPFRETSWGRGLMVTSERVNMLKHTVRSFTDNAPGLISFTTRFI